MINIARLNNDSQTYIHNTQDIAQIIENINKIFEKSDKQLFKSSKKILDDIQTKINDEKLNAKSVSTGLVYYAHKDMARNYIIIKLLEQFKKYIPEEENTKKDHNFQNTFKNQNVYLNNMIILL